MEPGCLSHANQRSPGKDGISNDGNVADLLMSLISATWCSVTVETWEVEGASYSLGTWQGDFPVC